jgi:hypothetical protein
MRNIILFIQAWFKARAAHKRRANYEAIKAAISKRHYDGHRYLTIKHGRYDYLDMRSFPRPMYTICRFDNNDWQILWDPKMLSEEIGAKCSSAVTIRC